MAQKKILSKKAQQELLMQQIVSLTPKEERKKVAKLLGNLAWVSYARGINDGYE